MRKAAHHYDDLNKDEQGRFFAQVMGFVAAYDNVYNQYQAGSLREDVFVSISKAYHGIISLPGAQTVLLENVGHLPPYLIDHSSIDVLSDSEASLGDPFEFLIE